MPAGALPPSQAHAGCLAADFQPRGSPKVAGEATVQAGPQVLLCWAAAAARSAARARLAAAAAVGKDPIGCCRWGGRCQRMTQLPASTKRKACWQAAVQRRLTRSDGTGSISSRELGQRVGAASRARKAIPTVPRQQKHALAGLAPRRCHAATSA